MPATRQPSERGIVRAAAQYIKRVHVPIVVVQIAKLDQGVAAEAIDQRSTPQLSVTKQITDDLLPVEIVKRGAPDAPLPVEVLAAAQPDIEPSIRNAGPADRWPPSLL
jgi:hypothetical protein